MRPVFSRVGELVSFVSILWLQASPSLPSGDTAAGDSSVTALSRLSAPGTFQRRNPFLTGVITPSANCSPKPRSRDKQVKLKSCAPWIEPGRAHAETEKKACGYPPGRDVEHARPSIVPTARRRAHTPAGVESVWELHPNTLPEGQMKQHKKADFDVNKIRRFLEPGPVVLVSSTHGGRAGHHDDGLAHDPE